MGDLKHLTHPVGQSNLNSTLNVGENKRTYSLDEVLQIVNSIVKEFGNILSRYCQPQMLLNSVGSNNLNSILLLSLLLKEKRENASPMNHLLHHKIDPVNLNPLSSFSGLKPSADLLGSNGLIPGLRSNDLSMLLNRQSPEKTDQKVSSENLLQIPKIVSCTGMNSLNLDMKLDGIQNAQPENSYNISAQILKTEGSKAHSELSSSKKYDSYQAETKEGPFSSPNL